jgi:hypothetical protein
MDFGPQPVSAQEIVGDHQPPRRVLIEQVVAAVAPEITQARG